MLVPAATHAGIIVPPAFPFADARLAKMEMCATNFRSQFKGDRDRTGRKGFPGIAEATGRFDLKDLTYFDHVRGPLEPQRPARVHLTFGFVHKSAFHLSFLTQRLEGAFRCGLEQALFFKGFGHVLEAFPGLMPQGHWFLSFVRSVYSAHRADSPAELPDKIDEFQSAPHKFTK